MVLVGYFNGQIFATAKNRKLTVMNEDLEIIKELAGINDQPRSISANDTFLALGNCGGKVQYYKRINDAEPKVSRFSSY